jgi:hypothetical protein
MSFEDFIAAVQAATYGDYLGHPSTEVRNERAFKEMRQYLLQRYAGVRVAATVVVGDQFFDCIVLPETVGATAPESAGCPTGTIPTRRITLEELTRFESLRAFLAKSPGKQAPPSR